MRMVKQYCNIYSSTSMVWLLDLLKCLFLNISVEYIYTICNGGSYRKFELFIFDTLISGNPGQQKAKVSELPKFGRPVRTDDL